MNIYYLCAIWCWDLRTWKWIKLQVPPSSREDRQKVTLMNKDKYSIDLCSTCHRTVEEGVVEFTWIWASHVAQFSSVQLLSCVRLSVTPRTAARQASLSITNSRSLLKLKSIALVMPSNHLILCHPFLLPPSIFPSIRVFSNELVLPVRWLKYWNFSFSTSPSNEYSGLISFRMDWLDLLAVQGTLKSLLQHHSSKASILQCSASFIVQLSHSYIPTRLSGKESICQAGDVGSSLGREDPLEKEMATHSSIIAWEIPWTEETGGLQSRGSQKSQTGLSD